jgi:hypothetical protein
MLTIFIIACFIAGALAFYFGHGLAARNKNPTLVWILGLLFLLLFMTGARTMVAVYR